jgi:alkylated DNA repair dioxygenase AlkB
MAELRYFPDWLDGAWVDPPEFTFAPGEDRATGEFVPDPKMLDGLERQFGIRFDTFAFQAYRNGSGTDWHADTPFDAQAVLSLGATRTFGVRAAMSEPTWLPVSHGDLVYMPSGFQDEWQHCVKVEDEPGERVSLVFRTAKR